MGIANTTFIFSTIQKDNKGLYDVTILNGILFMCRVMEDLMRQGMPSMNADS